MSGHQSGGVAAGPCTACTAEPSWCQKRIAEKDSECCTPCRESAGRTHLRDPAAAQAGRVAETVEKVLGEIRAELDLSDAEFGTGWRHSEYRAGMDSALRQVSERVAAELEADQ